MSGDCSLKLQQRIYEVLTAALGTQCPVYDHVPQQTPKPYAVIGEGDVGEFDTDTERGGEHRPVIHVFDGGQTGATGRRGKKFTKDVLRQIRDALDNTEMDLLPEGRLVFIYYEFSEAYLDPDGLTYHGVIRFRALTTEA